MKDIFMIFVIGLLGYLLGSIEYRGLKLGTSGVLLVSLVFGHYGFEVSSVLKNFGLVCFVASVGFIAGPIFFNNFKSKAVSYILLGFLIILLGTLTTLFFIHFLHLPKELAIGIFTGALTSTPGLGAAIEATGSDLASIGYGIAYPFGVIGVVLFVQLIPKLTKVDIIKEAKLLNYEDINERLSEGSGRKPIILDSLGMIPFTMSVVLGLLISTMTLPLPGGASFSLGISGGPLITGLLFGHIGNIKTLSIKVPSKTLETLRELGLMLFLIGAGTSAGSGFFSIVENYGFSLFLVGAMITLIPLVIGYIISRSTLKLSLYNTLGSICGGMTSTPALGALISVAKNDNVVASYAATYPFALICVILASQFMALL